MVVGRAYMEWVQTNKIHAGQKLSKAMFLPSGQMLLAAGVIVSEDHVLALRRMNETHVIFADSASDLGGALLDNDDLAAVASDRSASAHDTSPMVDDDSCQVDDDEERTDGTRLYRCRRADDLVQLLEDTVPMIDLRVQRQSMDIWTQAWPSSQILAQQRRTAVQMIENVQGRIETGMSVALTDLKWVVDQLLEDLLHHRHHFAQLAMVDLHRHGTLAEHSYATTVLAMAIAGQLNWALEDVRQMGMAGLMHDTGMLLVPERIRTGGGELTDLDRNQVQRHPKYSLSMMESVRGVPELVKLAAYQHHERENGTGYPNGLRSARIADPARVLAVADAFGAAASPRPYRRSKLPYVAMEEMVRGAATEQFHKATVRALVEAVGLFPVGSYVRLSNGHLAQVVAVNTGQLDRPVVQSVQFDGSQGPMLDLARSPRTQLSVLRPMEAPDPSAAMAG